MTMVCKRRWQPGLPEGLPARLDAASAAKLLGFAEHDIQVLLRTGKLTPLGDPAPNAPKWFAASS